MKYRKSYGEEIGPESPVIRDLWQIKNRTYLEKNKLAKNAKPLGVNGVKSLLMRAWRDSGIRTESKTRHDFKLAHGFRKAFKTICENSDMKSINVEVLMGHTLGVTSSYYKPGESSILADYEKAVDNLTINEENRLRKEVEYYKIEKSQLAGVMAQIEEMKKQLGLNF